MPAARDCVAKALTLGGPTDPEIDVLPPSGSGRVVMMLSGIDGTAPYKAFAESVAKLGYYVVLIGGRQILSEDKQGGDRLAKAIATAQGSAHAKRGKIAVVGFSVGGGGALAYAERQPETVATVITYYPATSFIAKVTDMNSFVDKFEVPLLAFAGGKDTFGNCCLLTTIQSMKATSNDLGNPWISWFTLTPSMILSRIRPIARLMRRMLGNARQRCLPNTLATLRCIEPKRRPHRGNKQLPLVINGSPFGDTGAETPRRYRDR